VAKEQQAKSEISRRAVVQAKLDAAQFAASLRSVVDGNASDGTAPMASGEHDNPDLDHYQPGEPVSPIPGGGSSAPAQFVSATPASASDSGAVTYEYGHGHGYGRKKAHSAAFTSAKSAGAELQAQTCTAGATAGTTFPWANNTCTGQACADHSCPSTHPTTAYVPGVSGAHGTPTASARSNEGGCETPMCEV